MVREAEAHAEKDKERKELIEAKNEADTLVYSTEKSLQEHKAKLSQVGAAERLTPVMSCFQHKLDCDDRYERLMQTLVYWTQTTVTSAALQLIVVVAAY